MQRRAAEESLTDHGKGDSNGRAHVGDAIRHKPEMLGFLRQIGFMGATGDCTAAVRGDPATHRRPAAEASADMTPRVMVAMGLNRRAPGPRPYEEKTGLSN